MSDGSIDIKSNGTVVAGLANTVYVPTPQALLAVLESLTSHQYILPDFVPELADKGEFIILTQARFFE